MKGLLRDVALVGITAIAVTGIQAYAQNDPTPVPNRFSFTCESGRLVVTDVIEHSADTAIILGMDIRGQVTVLSECSASFTDDATSE